MSLAGAGDNTTVPDITDDELPEIEARKGSLVRVVTRRDVAAVCEHCGRAFGNTGAAASHARTSRHRVSVDYSTQFAFVPSEQVR
jgi:hypothetical protein